MREEGARDGGRTDLRCGSRGYKSHEGLLNFMVKTMGKPLNEVLGENGWFTFTL